MKDCYCSRFDAKWLPSDDQWRSINRFGPVQFTSEKILNHFWTVHHHEVDGYYLRSHSRIECRSFLVGKDAKSIGLRCGPLNPFNGLNAPRIEAPQSIVDFMIDVYWKTYWKEVNNTK